MSEDREPWKRRFLLLLNNAQADKDLPKIWALFKRNNLATTGLIISATVEDVTKAGSGEVGYFFP